MKQFFLLLSTILPVILHAQVVNICTNPVAEQVMLGNYDPGAFVASTIIKDPATISTAINNLVSPDSLHTYLDALAGYKTRNSGSDTNATSYGIGAARNWAFMKFQQFSAQNDNRLIPAFLQFDTTICNITRHKDVLAVLPGADTSDRSIIIIEGHLDSRCSGLCDTACTAKGMEDNGSGTALVLELARIMSKYTYDHTIVFMLTTAEEQGLLGAQAMAVYVKTHAAASSAATHHHHPAVRDMMSLTAHKCACSPMADSTPFIKDYPDT